MSYQSAFLTDVLSEKGFDSKTSGLVLALPCL